jgi:hypothetical protein
MKKQQLMRNSADALYSVSIRTKAACFDEKGEAGRERKRFQK